MDVEKITKMCAILEGFMGSFFIIGFFLMLSVGSYWGFTSEDLTSMLIFLFVGLGGISGGILANREHHWGHLIAFFPGLVGFLFTLLAYISVFQNLDQEGANIFFNIMFGNLFLMASSAVGLISIGSVRIRDRLKYRLKY